MYNSENVKCFFPPGELFWVYVKGQKTHEITRILTMFAHKENIIDNPVGDAIIYHARDQTCSSYYGR